MSIAEAARMEKVSAQSIGWWKAEFIGAGSCYERHLRPRWNWASWLP
jgi:hypothetical protein